MADDGAADPPDGPSAGAVAAALVLVSAVALPLLGLRMLFGERRAASGSAAPRLADERPDPDPAPPAEAAPPVAASAPAASRVSSRRAAAAPTRDDVEAALVRLTDATVAPRRRRPPRPDTKSRNREASLRPS